MTTEITLLTNRTGGFETHVAGCKDIARASRRYPERVATFAGETLVDAIIAVDTDAASWFGEEPYTESSREQGCWAIQNGLEPAPCLVKLIRAEGIQYEPNRGRPFVEAKVERTGPKVRRVAEIVEKVEAERKSKGTVKVALYVVVEVSIDALEAEYGREYTRAEATRDARAAMYNAAVGAAYPTDRVEDILTVVRTNAND